MLGTEENSLRGAVQKKEKLTCEVQCGVQNKNKTKNLRVGYSTGCRRKLTCGAQKENNNNLCVGYRRKKNLRVGYSAEYRKRKKKKIKITCVWGTEERKTYVWGTVRGTD